MTLEQNKTLVRRYFEALQKPEIYDEILTPDFRVTALHHVTINPEGEARGPQAYKAAAQWAQSVWQNAHMTVDEVLAEGDRVTVVWTFHGVQTGEMFGLPPTPKAVSYTGINIFRIADGKLAEGWDMFDRLWLWQQLGVLPDTGEFLAAARQARETPRHSE